MISILQLKTTPCWCGISDLLAPPRPQPLTPKGEPLREATANFPVWFPFRGQGLGLGPLFLFLFFSNLLLAQQETPLTLRFENNSLPEAFQKISAAAGVEFSYDPSVLPKEKKVTATFERASLRQILDFLLKDTGLGYVTLGNRIIVKPRSELEPERPALFTFSGFIRDSLSGEELIGANVWETGEGRGCSSNEYGFYSLTLPQGDHFLKISYLGYQDKIFKVSFDRSRRFDFHLKPASGELALVVVTDSLQAQTGRNLGEASIPLAASGLLPTVLGEKDILKTLQLIPGVSSGADGLSSFGVRGGSPDQTLVLLDEAPLYNPTHLAGFFSVFNTEALKEMRFLKGAFPAQYGGRLSSVLEVFMKEGNANRFTTSGGIGLTSSRLQLEAPLFDKKGSVMAAGRRTYLDWFFKGKDGFHFFDGNLKGNVRLGEKDRLFVAGYFGRDVLRAGDDLSLNWGNATGTLRWNRLLDEKSFMNTSLIFSDYRFRVKTEKTNGGENNSGILNAHLKQTYRRYFNPRSTLTVGWSAILHRFKPGEYRNNFDELLRIPDRNALEAAVFASHEWQPVPWLEIQTGIRISNMTLLGTGEPFFFYDETGAQTDSVFFKKGERIVNYEGMEPRALLKFHAGRTTGFQLGYGRSYQYVQLAGNSVLNNPIDVWLPASPNIRPQIADQLDAGFFQQLFENRWDLSVEAFYKILQNQIEHRFPEVLLPSVDIESKLAFGTGRGYGVEVMLRKNKGRLQGWLGYAWAKHRRQFDQLNDGREFPARFDFTHSISAVGAYELGKKWTFAAVWTYRTGNPVTVPVGKYQFDNQEVVLFGPINGYRFPAYHRLDFSFTSQVQRGKYWESNWVLGLYNVYARRNPVFAQIEQDFDRPERVKINLIAPLLVIPAISWEFKF